MPAITGADDAFVKRASYRSQLVEVEEIISRIWELNPRCEPESQENLYWALQHLEKVKEGVEFQLEWFEAQARKGI